jgi:hypothetical protein
MEESNMKTQYIYVVIVLIILVSLIIFLYSLRKKKQVLQPEEKQEYKSKQFESSEEYGKTGMLSQKYGKTEALDESEDVESLIFNLNDDTNIDFFEITDLDKEYITGDLSSDETNIATKLGQTQILYIPEEEEEKVYATIIYSEDGKEKEFLMTSEVACIGRDPDMCDIVINHDDFIGRHHALIYHRTNKIYLVDVNSKNGIFIKDEKLLGKKEISHNTKIKLANTELIIRVGE